jgi:phosphatidylglycerol---prolipoprotein diacylglyceryl transferase
MHPELFRIGPVPIHAYGTLIVIGFVLGLAVIRIRIKSYNVAFDTIVDLSFGVLISGFVGAKLFHWLIIPSDFIHDMSLLVSTPINFAKNLGSGFEFFGGIVTGVLYFYYFCRKHSLDKKRVLDLITPAVPLAHAFGRLGCFMAGCCYGRDAPDLPWAVVFSDPNSLGPLNRPLHPTQLYEAVLLMILAVSILLAEKRIIAVPGRMISVYILGYTVIRFIVEYFRGDDRGFIPLINLSGTQVISIVVAAGAVFWLIKTHRAHAEK